MDRVNGTDADRGVTHPAGGQFLDLDTRSNVLTLHAKPDPTPISFRFDSIGMDEVISRTRRIDPSLDPELECAIVDCRIDEIDRGISGIEKSVERVADWVDAMNGNPGMPSDAGIEDVSGDDG